MTVGERVKALLDRRGWSLGQLSDRSGLDKGYLSQLTRGMVANPGSVTLRKIGDALGVRVSDLMGETEPMPVATTFQGVTFVPLLQRVAHATAVPRWVESHQQTPIAAVLVHPGMRPRAAVVTGDCLAPEIEAGDTVVWDAANHQPQNGDTVVVTHDGDLLVKRAYRDGDSYVLVDDLGNELRPNGAQLEGVVITILKKPRRRPRRA